MQCRIAGNLAADSDECSALQCSDVLEYRLVYVALLAGTQARTPLCA